MSSSYMSLTTTRLTNVAAFNKSFGQQRIGRRVHQVCRAADEDPKLSFDSNKRAALGFTESDSAGQTNIFAVEPKSYVAGSSRDETEDAGNSTVGAAAIAGTVAAGAFVAGLLLLNDSNDVDLGPTGDFLTLSQYKAQFAAEVSKPVAEAVTAPAVVDEN